MKPFDVVIQKLGDNVKKNNGTVATCQCPVHDDRQASLVVTNAPDNLSVLLNCHAGCRVEDIVKALNMEMKHLFDESTRPKQEKKQRGKIVATYDYTDENGELEFQTVRYEPKTFKQRQQMSDGKWVWNMQGCTRYPYRLPEMLEYLKENGEDSMIIVPEGEKDVNSLWELGLPATCNPGGAGKWFDNESRWMAKKTVCFIPDNDPPGRNHVLKAGEAFEKYGCTVYVLDLQGIAKKGDVTDWIEAGGTVDDLVDLIQNQAVTYAEWKAAIVVEKPEEIKQAEEQAQAIASMSDTAYLKQRGLMIVASDETGGFTMEAIGAGKRRSFKRIKDLDYNQLVALMGTSAAAATVGRTQAIADQNSLPSMSEFTQSVAGALYEHKETARNHIGDGIWNLEYDERKTAIFIVHDRRFYRLEGHQLVRWAEPVVGDYIIDHKASKQWCDFEKLQQSLVKGKAGDFTGTTFDKLLALLQKWSWQDEWMPRVAAGLYCAAWMQSIWYWRPIVALNGASSSGKSMMLEDAFKPMTPGAMITANCSEASLRQDIRTSSLPAFIDEFDKNHQDTKIHESLRRAGRGQEITRGTSSHNVQRFRLGHVMWLCGITENIAQIADKNRRIGLEMTQLEGKQAKIVLNKYDLRDLGYDILASCILVAEKAKAIEQRMLNVEMEIAMIRFHENYVVPFSAIEALTGEDQTVKARQLATEAYLGAGEDGYTNDWDELLATICRVSLRFDDGSNETVGNMIFNHRGSIPGDLLERYGIAVMRGQSHVAFNVNHMVGSDGLLGDTQFKGQYGISKILNRMPEAVRPRRTTTKMNGRTENVLAFDIERLRAYLENELSQAELF